MRNKTKKMILAALIGAMVCVPVQGIQAAQTDGTELFSDGSEEKENGITDVEEEKSGVSALASALAKQAEEDTQKIIEQEEKTAQVREDQKQEKEEQKKEAALVNLRQMAAEAKEKAAKEAAEEAEKQRLAKRQEVVDFALQFEGNPYVYGGTSLTNGADCSGFVMSVFANFGYSLPRVAAAQCEASTRKDISQLEPGDLVFYGSGSIDHVALYIGDGKIIHASGAATGIKIPSYDYEQPAAIGTFME